MFEGRPRHAEPHAHCYLLAMTSGGGRQAATVRCIKVLRVRAPRIRIGVRIEHQQAMLTCQNMKAKSKSNSAGGRLFRMFTAGARQLARRRDENPMSLVRPCPTRRRRVGGWISAGRQTSKLNCHTTYDRLPRCLALTKPALALVHASKPIREGPERS